MNTLRAFALTIEDEAWVHQQNRNTIRTQQKLHRQRMKELVKGTRYEETKGRLNSEGILAYVPEYRSALILDESENVHHMDVCVISEQEWQMLQLYLHEQQLYEQLCGWTPSIYECQRQQKADLRLPVCHTPDWITPTTYTANHLYHSDADATGTLLGIKAYNVYVFDIQTCNEYGLVTHSYFPSI